MGRKRVQALLQYMLHGGTCTAVPQYRTSTSICETLIMRPFFAFRQKKPLHSGSYEHRVPKIKNKTFFCMHVCVIQHRNWPLRSTILNAHGTNASPDGLCTRLLVLVLL